MASCPDCASCGEHAGEPRPLPRRPCRAARPGRPVNLGGGSPPDAEPAIVGAEESLVPGGEQLTAVKVVFRGAFCPGAGVAEGQVGLAEAEGTLDHAQPPGDLGGEVLLGGEE